MIVVADAGPILHLHWIGSSSWALPPGTIHVVDEVWIEIARHASEALVDARLVRVQAPADREIATRFGLEAGEAAAIAFALTREGATLLTDDEAARQACRNLALDAVGTIGLVLEAARAQRVSKGDAMTALASLPGKGRLHVRRELLERAIAAVRQ